MSGSEKTEEEMLPRLAEIFDSDDAEAEGIEDLRRAEDLGETSRTTKVHAFRTLRTGPPRSRGIAYALVVGGEQSVGRCHPIRSGSIIGRGIGADLILFETGVSRRHARVTLLDDGGFQFDDLESHNGIIVDGVCKSSHTVREGQRVGIGEAVIVPLYFADVGPELQRNLFTSATEDPSTRLAHRVYFSRIAAREYALAASYGAAFSVAMFMVDQHEALVRSLGPDVGKILLKTVGRVASKCAPRGTVIAHYTDQIVAALLPETSAAAACSWVELVRSQSAIPGETSLPDGVTVTLSVGIASLGGEGAGQNLRDLLAQAETCVATSKHDGGNRVTV